jgi:hypothetical protein
MIVLVSILSSRMRASFAVSTCVSFFHDVLGTSHRVRRVYFDNMPGHKPVEKHLQRRKILVYGRLGMRAL